MNWVKNWSKVNRKLDPITRRTSSCRLWSESRRSH